MVCGDLMSIAITTPIEAETIAAGSSYTTAAIEWVNVIGLEYGMLRPDGYGSVQVAISGSGTLKLEVLISNDDTNWLPDVGGAFAENLTSADTNKTYPFTIPVCKTFKIKGTETGGSNTVTVTGTLARQ